MKLFLNDSSPYARLVLVVIHEKHLIGEVELVWTDPWSSPPELMAVNPFAKVPALITREGLPLMDSVLICEYLIRIARGPALLADGGAPWLYALRKYAFGRGLIDAPSALRFNAGLAVPRARPRSRNGGSPRSSRRSYNLIAKTRCCAAPTTLIWAISRLASHSAIWIYALVRSSGGCTRPRSRNGLSASRRGRRCNSLRRSADGRPVAP